MSLNNRHKAILALIIANLIWGAASPIFKWSLTSIPPFTLAFFRFGPAALLLLPLTIRHLKMIEFRDLPNIFLFAFLGITFNISFFFLGLKLAPSINAALIGSIQPLFLLILGALFLKENVQKREIIGTIISFFGVLVVFLSPLVFNGYQGEAAVLGNFFFILATLGAVGQPFIGKQLFKKYPPLPITFLAFVIGTFSFVPFAIYEWFQNPNWFVNLQFPGIAGIVYGAIFSSALAYSLYDWGLSKIEASETGIYSYFIPIAAVIVATTFFGEPITPSFVVGSIFVFLGIILTENKLFGSLLHKLRKIC